MMRCKCGRTLEELMHGKRLGCPNCYNVFRDPIMERTKHFQLRNEHRGKEPSKVWQLHVDKLRRRMGRAAARDDFEAAGRLKVEIARIEREHTVQDA